ncbi:MAG: YwaF family protein [Lachnospiraceae bacterium]|nr:YwaF family protein [Lachnospiraceae bacterium]
MFSEGHILWIVFSFTIIIVILAVCHKLKPSIKALMKTAFCVGIVSEVIKVISAIQIVPMVDPVVVRNGDLLAIEYVSNGEYTPYLAMEHMPLELCSLYLVFMLLVLTLKDGGWKKGLYAVMFASGTIGGLLGILLSSIAVDFTTVAEFFSSVRAWQYFIYHSIIVAVSVYLGCSKEADLKFTDLKKAVIGIVLLDIPTFYINSVFSSEIYSQNKIVGVTHRINFFSSYVSPFGMTVPDKKTWLIYLVIRAVLALTCITLLFGLLKIKDLVKRKEAA